MSTFPANPIDRLVVRAFQIACRGGQEWARQQARTLDPDEFASTLRMQMKIQLAETMADAREAIKAGMEDAAEQTFRASCILIGIDAAKISTGVASAV